MVAKKEKPNFTEGPMFWRLLSFTLPIILTGLLQVLYNMADNIVVGRYSGDTDALAAVGQTSSFNALMVNLFTGLSLGAAIVVAQLFGAKRDRELARSVETAMSFSIIAAAIFFAAPMLLARPILSLVVKAELLPKSLTYIYIVCAGYPALTIYNFAAAIIRSTGDSKTPLIILSSSGLLNVLLNLLFVIPLKMSIVGVALATVISQYAAAVAAVIIIIHHKIESVRYNPRRFSIDRGILRRMLICGVPASLQSAIFSFSNMLITSAISTFPVETISGNTIASNIDSVNYTCMNAFTASTMTFAAQNLGARKHKRLWKVLLYAIIQVVVIGVFIAQVELALAHPLGMLFISEGAENPELIIQEAMAVMRVILNFHVLSGIMNALAGFLQGVGFATGSSISAVTAVLTVRLIWIYVFFPMNKESISWLYLCYPITWIFTILLNVCMIIYMSAKLKKLFAQSKEAEPATEEKVAETSAS